MICQLCTIFVHKLADSRLHWLIPSPLSLLRFLLLLHTILPFFIMVESVTGVCLCTVICSTWFVFVIDLQAVNTKKRKTTDEIRKNYILKSEKNGNEIEIMGW